MSRINKILNNMSDYKDINEATRLDVSDIPSDIKKTLDKMFCELTGDVWNEDGLWSVGIELDRDGNLPAKDLSVLVSNRKLKSLSKYVDGIIVSFYE